MISNVQAQQIRVLKGYVLYQNRPLPSYRINFAGHGDAVTQTDGQFKITLKSADKNADIKIILYDTLEILEPSNGRLPAYTDNDYYHAIYLGTNQSKKLLNQFGAAIAQEINQISNKTLLQTDLIIEAIEKSNEDLFKHINDSLRTMNELKDELSFLIEMQKKSFREQLVLPTMDSVFNIYLSRTKDLRDIMDQHGQSVFYNEIKANLIQEKIKGYNEAYETLITRKGYIINLTELYWDQSIPYEVRNLIDITTLHNFHKSVVLTSNVSIVNSIISFNNRERGRRKKSEIIKDIEAFVVQLNNGIEFISSEQSRIVQKMKAI